MGSLDYIESIADINNVVQFVVGINSWGWVSKDWHYLIINKHAFIGSESSYIILDNH